MKVRVVQATCMSAAFAFRSWRRLLPSVLVAGALHAIALPAAAELTGDCDGDGTVTVDDLLKGINVTRGFLSPETCPSLRDDVDTVAASRDAALSDALTGEAIAGSKLPDGKMSASAAPVVIEIGSATGLPGHQVTFSPWQNGVAERWVGTCRRELLDHVIVFNEAHLRRLLQRFLAYYHDDRSHLSLGKDPAAGQAVSSPPPTPARVLSLPRIGGLHRRDEWREAA